MPTNRHEIDDERLVRPPELLKRGMSVLGLADVYVVEPDWYAVISEGGKFKEVLEPGTYALVRFGIAHDVLATEVSRRKHTLNVETVRHFTIAEPYRTEINLDLAVDFQVCRPARVALEIGQVLIGLFNRVLEAARNAVEDGSYPEIETRTQEIARATLDSLLAMDPPEALGLEVTDVRVTAISAPDMVEYQRVMLMEHLPEVAKAITHSVLELERISFEKGLNPQQIRGELPMYIDQQLRMWAEGHGIPPRMLRAAARQELPPEPDPLPAGAAPAAVTIPPGRGGSTDDPVLARIRHDKRRLEHELPGARVEVLLGWDESTGQKDGTHHFWVDYPRISGGEISLRLTCPEGYPELAPAVEVWVDGEAVSLTLETIRHWDNNFLIDVADAVKHAVK